MGLSTIGRPEIWAEHGMRPLIGHTHVWDRLLSRRAFFGATAIAGGATLASGVLLPGMAYAGAPGPGTPKPIPETLNGSPFHIQLPGPGGEPSVITDFNGRVGIADILGTAMGSPSDPTGLIFDADMRFMSGRFVGTDGAIHQGTFGFV